MTEKNGWVRTFAADGRIASITDRNGNSLTFSYTDGRLISVTDANGRILTLAYDGSGVLQSLTDPGGHVYSLNYTDGLLTSVLYPDGATWQYTYGSNNLLTSKSDPAGNLSSYVHDTANRVTQAVDPQNRSRSFGHAPQASPGKVPDVYPAYRVPDRVFALTEQNGGEWSYQVDPSNEQVTSMTDPLGHETSYAYDSQGQLISKTEADVGTTNYTYDENGNLISMTVPAGQVTDLSYNDFGQVLTVSGAPGDYNFTYDQGGNLLTRTDPAGETTTYAYDGAGNLLSITDPLGRVTTLAYDNANNPVTLTRPTGAVYAMTYDAVGNLLTLSDPLNRVTTLTYDSRNQQATLTSPGGQMTTFTYDGNGNRIRVVDAKGNTTTYSYNHQRQVTAVSNALDHLTQLAYVAAGCPSCGGIDQLTAVTAANGGQTQFAYDLIGRLTTSTDPIGATATYSYNATRNPTQKTAGDGSSVSYSYDALQRLTGKTLSTGGSVTFNYDSRNNITSAVSAANSYILGYDDANRLISVSDSRGLSLAYQYDAAGNRTALILQPGTAEEQTFSYSYDNGRRLTGMLTPAGTFSFAYDLADRRTRLDYPNSIVGSYSYDDANQTDWLTGIDYTDAVTGSDLLAVGYPQHDAVGNRLQRSVDGTVTSYSYDATYQVTRAQTGPREENFSYDEVGNRESGPTVKDTPAVAYVHNPANQMLQGRKFDYQYDARGNQLYRMMNGAGSKYWAYTWNAENQLIQADLVNAGAIIRTVSFQYDAFGRRITKQASQDGHTTTTDYYYDGEDIILQVKDDGTTSTTTQYVHGPGIDEPLAMIQDGTRYFYHADGLGSIVALTDSNKQIVQRDSYDTFGMLTSVQNPEFNNSYTYTAREWDRELGLYYYRARYYDPMEGRFISKDPIGIGGNIYNQGVNASFSQYVGAVATPYHYTGNNSINRIDPLGLMWSGPGVSVLGQVLSGGGVAGVYRVQNWDTDKQCIILVSGGGLGGGLGASVNAESIWIWDAPTSKDLEGSANGTVAYGGAGVSGVGAGYTKGGCSENILTNDDLANFSESSSATGGPGFGVGAGYIVGNFTTRVIHCW